MKFYILTAVSLTIAGLVESRPMGECYLSAAALASAPEIDILIISPDTKEVFAEALAIAPAPVVISNPVNETGIVSEGEVGFQSQKIRDIMADIQLEEALGFTAARNTVGVCTEKAKEKCKAFIETDGVRCYNEATGVHCDTRTGNFCSDDAVELCYDFTDGNGLYCSNGSCNMFIHSE